MCWISAGDYIQIITVNNTVNSEDVESESESVQIWF